MRHTPRHFMGTFNVVGRNSHWLPRNRKEWSILAAVIVAFALIAHLTIGALVRTLGVVPQQPEWVLLLSALLYSSFITLSQVFSGELAHRFVPLRSKTAVVAHIGIQSASGILAFTLARQLEQWTTGNCSVPANMFIAMCSVTFVLTVIGNSGFYIVYYRRQMRAAEQAVLESELRVLRAQINPHFLFNTLNSIAALIRSNPDQAESVTEYLADLFRYSLRSSKTPLVTLDEELHSVQLYLRIEQARFADRLVATIDVPLELRDAAVPSLMLQPLVENAVKHGLGASEDSCSIRLIATRTHNVVEIRVEDTGPGFLLTDEQEYFHKGTGLMNVCDRLTLMFPDNASLQLERHAVVLHFPYRQRVDAEAFVHAMPHRS